MLLKSSVLLIFFFFISCGLIGPVPFLEAPTMEVLGNRIKITHNTKNNVNDFIGYDIYYKLYANDSTVDEERIKSDIKSIQTETAPGINILESSLSFRKITLYKDETPFSVISDNVLIAVRSGKDTAHEYIIDLSENKDQSQTPNIFLQSSSDNAKFVVGRHSSINNSRFTGFLQKTYYQETHQDHPSGASQTLTEFKINFAVVARGITTPKFENIYSKPVTLGVNQVPSYTIR